MSNYQDFEDRHIGPSASDESEMLGVLGYSDIKKFIADVVPENIHIEKQLKDVLDGAKSEVEVIAELREIASQNEVFTSLIGGGYYGTITPPVIKRNVLENPAWYTAYTPYQPEISQGRLEALFAFQTVICDMTALALSNASMLDEGTAAAEAMTLARRSSRASDDAVFLIEEHVHPQTKAVVATRAKPLGITVVEVDSGHVARDGYDGEFFGLLLQYPDTTGEVCDYAKVTEFAHSKGALVIAATDLLALTLLKAPGEWGADIAVGSAQRFGIPMGFGGPHAGFMAVRTGLERSLPGRLVGQSVDAHGNPAFRLALQTREQHIRRDKATSNICTAQVLLANMSAFYAMWHGPKGLQQIATRIHGFASRLQKASSSRNGIVFDTVTVDVKNADVIHAAAKAKRINFGRVSDTEVRISFDETTTEKTFADVLEILGLSDAAATPIAVSVLRSSKYLQHPVFNTYFSETSMLRYLRTLADRDLALDRTMIPLGSCTMKLNATTEMEAVTWPEFASLHPFAPVEQTRGSRLLIDQLSKWLVEITGYDAVSLQPNAGSQGEFAGLLAIRNYHDSRGDQARNICLIPSSAHGTNAASAVMAGMKVVVIECDEAGNVSVDDLKAKIAEHGSALAALMVTYPSTHGVFESAISEICGLVHDAGGQVYVDGANLNALVGTAQPGKFGADVSHLNLHKTFCIPHGGGGPGVGPVISKAHLAPFLPNHPMDALAGPATGPGPISAAPFGSASILPISWAYIRLMGGEGLTHATEVAILNANYMAHRLKDAYPILYTGNKGLVAHECILDVREITKVSGVTVDDIAKRLMDFGFHAPTMSFPVAGTLMIEPTESEDVLEMNRFIDAMIAIRGEIQEIIDGKIAVEESALRHAPHTIGAIAGTNWERSYPRERGAFPATLTGLIPGELIGAKGKYWPTTGRIDGAYGDRNLVCSCPPIEAFA
ncbi:glycine dehydrogenase [Candidatus Planktophila sulfonica]|uniref:Glycine dehydrogenase (decarboxylating) n=1 Tax=Candidatus Planktophila sulfonica TaxID=1884904 RepID=A0A249KGJ4_9ACTN|nr:aminomethyl-transferring glycine dehydrogenase [Candidatus Planktophila sulfonica]ASY15930.1 glycine dehydrogenase [Candidatus Planktophila sulfonica]